MIGRYVTGCGQAHKYAPTHAETFGQKVMGTFNVRVDGGDLDEFAPTIRTVCRGEVDQGQVRRYWPVLINETHFAWAMRWEGSRQPPHIWELYSVRPLPDSLKTGEFGIRVLEP